MMISILRFGAVLVVLLGAIGIAVAQQAPGTGPTTTTPRAPAAATGGKPELTPQQRASMYTMVMSTRPKQAPAGVSLRIGAKIPATVELSDLPAAAAQQAPSMSQFKFVVVQNQVALVDPGSSEIVEILQQR
jgi:hypothetical protein